MLLTPLVPLALFVAHPVLSASLLSTAAIAVHQPRRFRRTWAAVVRAYAVAAVVALLAVAVGAALGTDAWVPATVAAGVVLVSRSGRVHPPTAGLPLVLAGSGAAPAALAATAAGLAYVLMGLRLLSRQWSDARHLVHDGGQRESARRRMGYTMRISASETAAGRDTVGRTALLLEAVSQHPLGIGLTELTAATGMKKATVHRIAERLITHQLLQRTLHGYQLGLRFFEWARNVPVSRILRTAAMPTMAELSTRTGLTVELAVCSGTDVVIVERIPGSVSDTSMLPDRRPALHTALGLAILAFSSPTMLDHARESLPTTTPPLDPATLDAELADVRRHRLVRETGRYDPRWAVAAAPVVAMAYLGTDDFPACAVIGVIGPATTAHVERAAPLVRDAGLALSRRLSVLPSHPAEEWPVPVVPRSWDPWPVDPVDPALE
ncbi:IclR family transcriptional regulator [Kribbella sp. NPDC051620]|uniref:IclR family transcriptional regulator n=1 Tax=Kribbella sp. NPDC051620 TaxID=3364120 RepID=UPI00379AC48F